MVSKTQNSAKVIPNINQINPYFPSVPWASRHWVIQTRRMYQNGFAIMNITHFQLLTQTNVSKWFCDHEYNTLAITNLLRVCVIISD